jgi:hypothetical protein
MTGEREEGGEPFALKYGALEALLTELVGARDGAVLTRFRKLRPKFAADGLLTETGNRVSYDLTRVLAICAIYEINALSIPQGHAVDIVVANWPEVAKACLAAWRGTEAGHGAAPAGSPVVRIYVDAINESPGQGSWASVDADAVARIPHVALDCRPLVDAVSAAAERSGQSERLVLAFAELDGTFGWDSPGESDPLRLPRRLESGFFGTGPYFDRARALLSVDPEEKLHSRQKARLQALLGYLEEPAPIDSWKRFIGTDESETRLIHTLAARGRALGLASSVIGQVAIQQIAFEDQARAIDLIGRGEAHLATLQSGGSGEA